MLAAQFERACELGATRIVCLAESQSPEILALQLEAEKRKVEFHLISEHLALVRLVTADNELILFQDGVLIDRAAIASELSEERGILVVPADAGVSNGLERIDAKWAWGGLLIARADIVAKLVDLPSDSDPASLLLRLALQAGVPLSALDADHLSAGTILLVDDAESLTKREAAILHGAMQEQSWAGPSTKLVSSAVKAMFPKVLDWRGGLAVGGSGLAVGALVLAILGSLHFGGGFLTLAAFIFGALYLVDALLKKVSHGSQPTCKASIFNVLFDISIVVFVGISLWATMNLAAIALAPILVGLNRLAGISAERFELPTWQDFWQDRVILTLSISLGIFWDAIVPILATLSLAMLAFVLICEERRANSRVM
ncbi:MAG: hypothetical protein ABJD95_09420 [Marinomonas sp.]